MHQQIRLKLAGRATLDTPGAMPAVGIESDPIEIRPGSLVDLLDELTDEGYQLRMVGGSGVESTGAFVFAIEDDDQHSKTAECATFLQGRGYRGVRVVEPELCEVEDRPGALADCLRKFQDRQIHELFVGTPRDGLVPVQITTIRTVGLDEAS